MKKYDWLIVGSGLFGATFANLAKKDGQRCLVIDKRKHIGGNLYCETRNNIIVHKYGAHIFHTSNKEIWDFVNNICDFTPYCHQPIANYNGELYNLPFNLNTFYRIWGAKKPNDIESIIKSKIKHIEKINNLEEQALSLVVNEFISLGEASLATGINTGNICRCCNGKVSRTGIYFWKYKEV